MGKKNNCIGIMVPNCSQRMYVLKQYLRYHTAKSKLFCFSPALINWEKKHIIGLHHLKGNWVQSTFPFPKVVYNRCYNKDIKTIQRLGTVIGSNKCFNQINQFNKNEIYVKLYEFLFDYLPETIPYDKHNAARLLQIHNILYFKPCYGHKGIGVYRAERKDSGEIHIGHHYFSPINIVGDLLQFQENMEKLLESAPYLIQKGIQMRCFNDQIFDIRALLQKNNRGLWSITNVISRIAYKGSFNTSICERFFLSEEILKQLYSHEKANAILRSIYNISLRVAEILDSNTNYHLGEFSVDFALDYDDQLWIMELNGMPQKDLYNRIRNQYRVYKRPLQYAYYLCIQ